MEHFLDCCLILEGSVHSVSGTTSGLVVLGGTRKQSDEALMSKPARNVPPKPPLQFLPKIPAPNSLNDELLP